MLVITNFCSDGKEIRISRSYILKSNEAEKVTFDFLISLNRHEFVIAHNRLNYITKPN